MNYLLFTPAFNPTCVFHESRLRHSLSHSVHFGNPTYLQNTTNICMSRLLPPIITNNRRVYITVQVSRVSSRFFQVTSETSAIIFVTWLFHDIVKLVTAFTLSFKVYTTPCLHDNGEEIYNTR